MAKHGYEQYKVEELRVILATYGVPKEEADELSKTKIVEKLIEVGHKIDEESSRPVNTVQDEAGNILDTISVETEEENQSEEDVEVPPDHYSPEWHDYVMRQFTSDEIIDGNPSTDGLRRVAGKLLEGIRHSSTEVVGTASDANGCRATVVVTIEFGNGVSYSGAADSAHDNTDEVYRRYPTAIAESRAEGRALRRALNLRKTVAADEISTIAKTDAGGGFVKIQPEQIKAIDLICKRMNVNVIKFINSGTKQYQNIKDVDYDTAIKMMQELNRYQVDQKNPDNKNVPDAIAGYVDNWNSEE